VFPILSEHAENGVGECLVTSVGRYSLVAWHFRIAEDRTPAQEFLMQPQDAPGDSDVRKTRAEIDVPHLARFCVSHRPTHPDMLSMAP